AVRVDVMVLCDLFFFFFSSRRRHTRWPRDWSSDVCSSDLRIAGDDAPGEPERGPGRQQHIVIDDILGQQAIGRGHRMEPHRLVRSEERRVGKECRSRWWAYHKKKKKERKDVKKYSRVGYE